MRINENTKIIGNNVILVPYEPDHVEKYHCWMENEEIRRLTGSERLSLKEEYEMQKSWREDEDKLTFIVLSKELFSSKVPEIETMIGDVNLFIDHEEKSAEAEVMIAEPTARGKGAAAEAIKLLFSYAIQTIHITKFFAKISDDNKASLHLFEDKLGFQRVSHSTAFKEYTLELLHEKVSVFKDYLTSSQLAPYR